MDIWEANLVSTAYTPHPCSVDGQTRCESDVDCGAGDNRYAGVCDKDGCDFNSFRMGDETFYGTGLTVDTSKPITVVTQFITDDGTDTGTLSDIKRFYVQDGKTIPNSLSSVAGVDATNSITDGFCEQQKTAFGDNNYFATKGGLAKMGEALKSMVLVLSIVSLSQILSSWFSHSTPPFHTHLLPPHHLLSSPSPGHSWGHIPRSLSSDFNPI